MVLHKSADNSRDVSVARSGPAEVALSPGAWLLYDGNNYFVIPGNGAALARIYRACTRRGCRNPRDRNPADRGGETRTFNEWFPRYFPSGSV